MKVAEINQFGSAKPVGTGPGPGCAECEAMLADAVDGALSAAEQAAFDRHIASCDVCSEMLADAQRGAALLSMLKSHRPEPGAALLDRIFAQTSGLPASGHTGEDRGGAAAGAAIRMLPASGVEAAAFQTAGGSPAAPFAGNVLPFRKPISHRFHLRALGQTMLQPRLAMTAAMAFFSIALTLNLTGIHLDQLKAADLKPSNLRRSLYDADARAVRYYENLRVVYELESRVRDLQRANDSDAPAPSKGSDEGAQPEKQKQQKQDRPKPGSGSSSRQNLIRPEVRLAADPAAESAARTPLALLAASESFHQIDKFKEDVLEGGLV
jgi:Putative zinc-finger